MPNSALSRSWSPVVRACVAAALVGSASVVHAATYSYDSGGAANSWSDGANWDDTTAHTDAPAGGPTSTDNINQAGTPGDDIFVILGGNRTVNNFTWSTAGFEVRAQTTASLLTINGTLTKDTDTGSLVFREAASTRLSLAINNINLSAGSITFQNSITGGTLDVTGTTTVSGTAALNNNYTSNIATYGAVSLSDTGRFYTGPAAAGAHTVSVASLASTFAGTIVAPNSSSGTALTGTLELAGTSGTTTYAGRLTNNAGSNGASSLTVNKTGGSTQILTGTNSNFTGGLTIDEGTVLSNNASGTATGGATNVITVNDGGRLGGTGFVTSLTTVNNNGKLLGGDGSTAADDLSLSNNLTMGDGSIVELVLGPGNAHSSITRTGGTWTFDSDQAFSLINEQVGTYDNILFNLDTDPGVAGWTTTVGGFTRTFSFDGDNVDLVVSVPEPASIALFGLGGLLALRRRSRR